MQNSWTRLISATVAAAGAALFTIGMPAPAQAQTLPGKVTALPNPPGAPQRDVFLITLPHSRAVPARAVFQLTETNHGRITATATFKKLNHYQYETYWAVPAEGHLRFQAYTADNHLVAEAQFPVTRAKTNVVGRLLLGAVFIGASLWLWWRQQRFYRRPH